MSKKIDKLKEALESESEGVEVEIEIIEPDSIYATFSEEEWELYKDFEAMKGNKVIHLTGEEEEAG